MSSYLAKDECVYDEQESKKRCMKANKNLANLKDNEVAAILVATGTFSPIHRMHIAGLELAKEAIEENEIFKETYRVIGGFISPTHESYCNYKLGNLAISSQHRNNLIDLALKDHPWIELDPWHTYQEEMVAIDDEVWHAEYMCQNYVFNDKTNEKKQDDDDNDNNNNINDLNKVPIENLQVSSNNENKSENENSGKDNNEQKGIKNKENINIDETKGDIDSINGNKKRVDDIDKEQKSNVNVNVNEIDNDNENENANGQRIFSNLKDMSQWKNGKKDIKYKVFYVCGTDLALKLSNIWRYGFHNYGVCIIERGGYRTIEEKHINSTVRTPVLLIKANQFDKKYKNIQNASSTEIRKRIEQGKPFDDIASKSVQEYMIKYNILGAQNVKTK